MATCSPQAWLAVSASGTLRPLLLPPVEKKPGGLRRDGAELARPRPPLLSPRAPPAGTVLCGAAHHTGQRHTARQRRRLTLPMRTQDRSVPNPGGSGTQLPRPPPPPCSPGTCSAAHGHGWRGRSTSSGLRGKCGFTGNLFFHLWFWQLQVIRAPRGTSHRVLRTWDTAGAA